MKEEPSKMSSTKRQELILKMLKETNSPITGTDFAKLSNVSRQVIVQDVAILKVKGEPIIATSQGYLLLNNQDEDNKVSEIIICKHSPEQTEEELYHIVDQGVTVKNVIVEHPVYGDLTASIMVSNRAEVDQFLKKVNDTRASYLSTLTNGIHLHTLESDSIDKIQAAQRALKEAGILV